MSAQWRLQLSQGALFVLCWAALTPTGDTMSRRYDTAPTCATPAAKLPALLSPSDVHQAPRSAYLVARLQATTGGPHSPCLRLRAKMCLPGHPAACCLLGEAKGRRAPGYKGPVNWPTGQLKGTHTVGGRVRIGIPELSRRAGLQYQQQR
jgi:hypothetical protein